MNHAAAFVMTYVAQTVEGLRAKKESGQGSVEYAGVVFVVAAIIGAVIAAAELLTDTSVAQAIMNKLSSAVGSVNSAP
ncbi:hypothetical protein VV01_16275 [Luteipulveratus halotolerans]|uniref:Uncharacterized protein n=2 Tax=Luteipulveratus halotolerans TaxID=1631356 RepID=A0A0L6CL27_9MICO|nr:hypothetical protein VV01_16275 [Luteipulveratus halotolerans]